MALDRKLLIAAPVLVVLLVGALSVYRQPTPGPIPAPPAEPPALKTPKPKAPKKEPKATLALPEPKSTRAGPVPILELLVLKEDVVRGDWTLSDGRLTTSAIKFGTIQFPCLPPDEYDLECVATRVSHTDSLVLGLVFQGKQCQVVLDGNNGSSSWLWVKNGKKGISEDGITSFQGPVLRPKRAVPISVSVRKDRLTVKVDSFNILDWRGPSERLSVMEHWEVPHPGTLFLGSWQSAFSIEQIVVTPVQGAVGILR